MLPHPIYRSMGHPLFWFIKFQPRVFALMTEISRFTNITGSIAHQDTQANRRKKADEFFTGTL